jgi:hypothetical protein
VPIQQSLGKKGGFMKRVIFTNLLTLETGRWRTTVLCCMEILFLAALLFCFGCANSGQKSASGDKASTPDSAETAGQPATPQLVTVPGGTVLTVRLFQTMSSRSARSGQEFAAELAAPVLTEGSIIFPKSTRVHGLIVAASESGRLHEPGYLRLTLEALQRPDGKWIDVHTTSLSAEGGSHDKRNLTLIGGGAGLGALIGGIVGGGKAATIGAASGAGAGAAGAYITGEEDVAFSSERKLKFVTVEELVMNR